MKRTKNILALAVCAVLSAATFFGFASAAQAEELTQVKDGTKVTYGTVSAEDQALLKVLFDAGYYAYINPDLYAKYGNDENALFNHFITTGIWEGRQGNQDFNVDAYASAYSDLKAAYGNDILAYYRHFINTKGTETRPVTTLHIASQWGITVTSLVDSSLVVTPHQIYMSEINGVNDLESIKHGELVVDKKMKAQAEAEEYRKYHPTTSSTPSTP
ncbi:MULTISPECIES: hypothetical protein [Pseudobutyrivibrio]|uniref:Uncharacterized protein n=1 Tax=Pseudobutyrivibrio xylanivorans TaxID=185007 RepID=A0A1G5S0Y7_PSEXY|nr:MULTISPECIES: hypothetical protein [Pseudobutyrivibrio]MDC7279571.1 hypothetical protein [Butyrivibrio fibrisolvens]SCZ79983.1 hypothetical protein SAMN02910350_02074 [Pseudobutyrivibrio xylanivorans]